MAAYPNRINELRRARGLSQDQLANEVGCSKMQISGLERGKPELNLSWMRRLAPALGVAPVDLLNPVDNPLAFDDDALRYVDRYVHADPDTRANLDRVSEALTGFNARPVEEERLPRRKRG